MALSSYGFTKLKKTELVPSTSGGLERENFILIPSPTALSSHGSCPIKYVLIWFVCLFMLPGGSIVP